MHPFFGLFSQNMVYFCWILVPRLSEFFNLDNDFKKSNSLHLLMLPIRQALLVLYMHHLITYSQQTHELGIFFTPLVIYLCRSGSYHGHNEPNEIEGFIIKPVISCPIGLLFT